MCWTSVVTAAELQVVQHQYYNMCQCFRKHPKMLSDTEIEIYTSTPFES